MGKKTQITELEKACLTYAFFHGMKYNRIYSLSHPDRPDSSQPSVSRWVNSEPIQHYIQELETIGRLKVGQAVEKVSGENSGNSSGELFADGLTDFTDLSQFIQFLNNKANSISDESQRQKYLSMLSDLLRFKEAGTDKNNDIQRFYTPLTCKNCQLYINQHDKTTL